MNKKLFEKFIPHAASAGRRAVSIWDKFSEACVRKEEIKKREIMFYRIMIFAQSKSSPRS